MTPQDRARIERRLDQQDEVLGEIQAGVEKLSARTLKIELWQSRISGALALAAFLVPLAAGFFVLH